MALQRIEIRYFDNASLTFDVFPLGSDAPVAQAVPTSEESNRIGFYIGTVDTTAVGWHTVTVFVEGGIVATYDVYLTNQAVVHYVEDRSAHTSGMIDEVAELTTDPGSTPTIGQVLSGLWMFLRNRMVIDKVDDNNETRTFHNDADQPVLVQNVFIDPAETRVSKWQDTP